MPRPLPLTLSTALVALAGVALAGPTTRPAPVVLDATFADGSTQRRFNLTPAEAAWVNGAFPDTRPAEPPVVVVPPVVVPPVVIPPVVTPDPNIIRVAPGESWVAAVRKAKSGQTVRLAAGVWTEGLTDTTIRLLNVRIEGAGRDAENRPLTVVRVPSGSALAAWCWDNTGVRGIDFQAAKATDPGVRLWGCHGVTLSDCGVTGYTYGVTVQSASGGGKLRTSQDATFARCRIVNNADDRRKPDGSWPEASGIFADSVTRLTLDACLLDQNGWRPGGSPGSIKNHNVYVAGNCGPATVTGCVFSRASSHGLQMRPGGTVDGNTFLDNPIHLSFGLVNGNPPFVKGGVTGRITNNVFSGTRLLAGQPRGYAVEISNALNVAVTGNTFASDHAMPDKKWGVVTAAIKVDVMSLKDNPQAGQQITVNTLVVANNSVTWPGQALWVHPDIAKAMTKATAAKPGPRITAQQAWPAADVATVRAQAVASLAAAQ